MTVKTMITSPSCPASSLPMCWSSRDEIVEHLSCYNETRVRLHSDASSTEDPSSNTASQTPLHSVSILCVKSS